MSRRILFVSSNASHIRNFHLPYIKALQERGCTVDVACGCDEKGVTQADHLYALPFVKKMTSLRNFAAVLELRKLLQENRSGQCFLLAKCISRYHKSCAAEDRGVMWLHCSNLLISVM